MMGGYNERLCAVEFCFRLKIIPPQAGLETGRLALNLLSYRGSGCRTKVSPELWQCNIPNNLLYSIIGVSPVSRVTDETSETVTINQSDLLFSHINLFIAFEDTCTD